MNVAVAVYFVYQFESSHVTNTVFAELPGRENIYPMQGMGHWPYDGEGGAVPDSEGSPKLGTRPSPSKVNA